ncbi:hypothetical protein ACQYWY_14510 [Comamonas sediminis]|uniref:hypothetical protein n=1 Tax=Comamonas sediminis TaxID=1783360 RepID=UPI003D2BE50E
MNTGFFAQPNPPYCRANYLFAYQWLEKVASLAALLAHVEALRAAGPGHRYLSTLDDIQQASYTSGHASQDDRLYLASPPDMDWDDPAQEAAWELQALQHRARQLRQAQGPQRWAEVCGSLALSGSDIDALLAANRCPDLLLDEVIYIQRLPLADADPLIAGQPNGYFSADWDSFQNHAIHQHLAQQHGYQLYAMGAAWMALARPQPPDAAQAQALVEDLRALYASGDDALRAHAGWQALPAVLHTQRSLVLGYTEDMADRWESTQA